MIINLLKMSVMSSVTICIVLLIRLCLRKAPKIFSYALWFVVLFRLLCPISVALPVSFFNLLTTAPTSPAITDQLATESTSPAITDQLPLRTNPGNTQAVLAENTRQSAAKTDTIVEESLPDQIEEDMQTDNVTKYIIRHWQEVFTIIWLCGVFIMLALTVADLCRLYKKLKFASLDKDNIYLLDDIPSPFVAGILRPRIYLPYGLAQDERKYVLQHEQTHIHRGDPIFRGLSYLALMLHWFNPFVWAAFFLSGKDMEMSCDEKVLQSLGAKIKCEYSQSLLLMAQDKRYIWNIPFAFGKSDIKERIRNILNYKKATVRVILASMLTVVLTAATLGADPIQQKDTAAQNKDAKSNEQKQNVLPQSGKNFQQQSANHTQADEDEQMTTTRLSVRSVSRKDHCINQYVAPDTAWKKTYGSKISFAQDCRYFINYCRGRLDALEVSFEKFAKAIEQGDIIMNKSCILEIDKKDLLIHKITLESSRYRNGVSYVQITDSGLGADDTDYNIHLQPQLKKYNHVRTEKMDLAAVPGKETIKVYQGLESGCHYGIAVFEDKEGNILHSFCTSTQGMCQCNLYIGNMDGAGDPFILEVHLENRDTYGEYSYYVYTLGKKRGKYLQTDGSCIEWKKDSSLVYDPDEMAIFFHMLGHYLSDSHLLVGLEMTDNGLKLRTNPECDEERYTYAKCAPGCFPDPYEGKDIR